MEKEEFITTLTQLNKLIDQVILAMQVGFPDAANVLTESKKRASAPTQFNKFAEYFLDNYYKEKVVEQTFHNTVNLYKRWLKPHFTGCDIRSLTPADCKALLDKIKKKGLHKTADDVHTLVNQIFKYAIAFGIVQQNPLSVVPYRQHQRKNGSRLTATEAERLLLLSKPQYRVFFAIYLYTGIRPGEMYFAEICGHFIETTNLKRKNHTPERKKIPIIQALSPFLQKKIPPLPRKECLRLEFKRILPNHTLKDCRMTFNSVCKECGVNDNARKFFMGHSISNLDKAYTEFTDEFLISEAAKVDAYYLKTQAPNCAAASCNV